MSKRKIKKELKAASKDIKAAESRLTKHTNLNVRKRGRGRTKWRKKNNKPRRNNKASRRNGGNTRVAKLSELPAAVKTYIEAVSDPFSPRGLGALIPDATTFDRTSATDRNILTFEADKFASSTASSPYNSTSDLAGVLFVLLPRSISSGFGTSISRVTSDAATAFNLQVPYTYYQDSQLVYNNTSTSVTPSDANAINHACVLCVIPVDTDGNAVRIPSYTETQTIGGFAAGTLMKGPSFVKLEREDSIFDNAIDSRIVGGGLKVNTISAQLYTGGVTITGYIPSQSLYHALRDNVRSDMAMDVPRLFTDRKILVGLKGATVRMRSTQKDMRSREFNPHVLDTTFWAYDVNGSEYGLTDRSYEDGTPILKPKYKKKLYHKKSVKLGEIVEEKEEFEPKYKLRDKYNKTVIRTSDNNGCTDKKKVAAPSNDVTQIVFPDWGADLAVYDYVGLGNKLPAIYYSFNVGDPNGNPNLNVQTIVHYEIHAEPTCPFQAQPTNRFRDIVDLQAVLDEPEHAPYYASGNSLKSVMGKIGRFAKRVPQYLSKAAAVSAVIAEML